MSTKKLQIVTPIVTSINDKTGNVTLEQSDISGLTDTLSGKVDKHPPSNAKNVALLDTSGDLLDSGKQLTAASIGAIDASAGAVGTNNLANRSVTNAKIAFGAVSTGTIADNAITAQKIADGAITENQILDGAITTNKIASGAITDAQIADGTITAEKMVDGVLPTIVLDKDVENGVYIYVLDINGEHSISIKEATAENIETELGYKPADPSKFLPLTGGTLTGNLTGKYLTGTWLQTTAVSRLGSTPTKFAVLDASGWVYYRTAEDMQTDLGIPTKDWVTAQIQSAVDATWEASY